MGKKWSPWSVCTSDLVLDLRWPRFQLYLDFVKTHVLWKFHKDWIKLVASVNEQLCMTNGWQMDNRYSLHTNSLHWVFLGLEKLQTWRGTWSYLRSWFEEPTFIFHKPTLLLEFKQIQASGFKWNAYLVTRRDTAKKTSFRFLKSVVPHWLLYWLRKKWSQNNNTW